MAESVQPAIVNDGTDDISVLADGADNATNTENELVTGSMGYVFDGSTWDRSRSAEAVAGNGALTETGVPAIGVGPGFDHRINPANLGTAVSSASAVDVNGAGVFSFQLNTTTTGSIAVEGTIDGVTWFSLGYGKLVSSGAIGWQAINNTFVPAVGDAYVAPCGGLRQVRLRTSSTLGATVAHVFSLGLGPNPYLRVSGVLVRDEGISASTGSPVLVGARASTAVPSPVNVDGDMVDIWATRYGAQIVAASTHIGLNSDPYNLVHEAAQYTTTQTSAVLIAGGASEKLVVTKVQIQVGGTTAGTLQLYFGTGAFARGTNRAIFDGEFAPSATLKPGVVMDGPFISGTNGDDLLVTTSAAINPLTINVWYYVVL